MLLNLSPTNVSILQWILAAAIFNYGVVMVIFNFLFIIFIDRNYSEGILPFVLFVYLFVQSFTLIWTHGYLFYSLS